MAKRKTAARKTTRHVAGGESHPYRAGSASKHVSASPSVASSPSPQPQDLVQLRRRKGTPVRSPSHGDTSKGIVFAFRIKKDADLSMAVDILSYDQVPEEGSLPLVTTAAAEAANSTVSTTAASIASGPASTTAAAAPIQLRVAGKQWSSDPSSFPSNNVMDLTRNMLILHSRKPQDPSTPSSMSLSPSPSSYYPYRRPSTASRSSSMSFSSSSSQPSTPALSDSGSLSSSPSSSPSSPSIPLERLGMAGSDKELCSLDSLSSSLSPFETMRSQPARMLSVRGLGAGTRRMQVYLV